VTILSHKGAKDGKKLVSPEPNKSCSHGGETISEGILFPPALWHRIAGASLWRTQPDAICRLAQVGTEKVEREGLGGANG